METRVEPVPAPADQPWLEVSCSRHFTGWLEEHQVSLSCSTYHTGKLFLLGRKPDGQLDVFERTFSRCMGLCVDGQNLWMSTEYQIWKLSNLLPPGELYRGYDRLYVPLVGETTGDIDVHDMVVESSGRLVYVATMFGCLATQAERAHFTPLWRPPFLSQLVAEDRCHLNGLALEDGHCKYVTAVSTSDVVDGWRDRRRDGGVVMEVPSGQIIASGLSMPHSPRVHQGALWVLNSGTGYLGKIDRQTGAFEPVTFCPGYLRGLTFVGDYAVVGTSQPRHDKTFGGLAVDEELARRGAEARCGLLVIHLGTGTITHWVRFEGMVTELYDVVALPGVTRPMAFGFKTDEIRRNIIPAPAGIL